MSMGFGMFFDKCAGVRLVENYIPCAFRAGLLVADAFGEGAAALAGDFDEAGVAGDLV
jgi:hypothetical protein